MAIFNVTTYGATGNGTTDDTVAIQAAVNAAVAAQGGQVYLPKGNYRTTASINVLNGAGISIVGDSSLASRLLSDFNGDTLRIVGCSGVEVFRLGFMPKRVKASGNEILMERSGAVSVDFVNIADYNGGKAWRGIEMVANGNQFKYWIDNTEINNTQSVGLLIGARNGLVQDVWLRNLLISNGGAEGVLIHNGSGIDVFNLETLGTAGKGFATYPRNGELVKSIKIVNGIFDTTRSDGVALLTEGTGQVTDSQFSNCWFSNNEGHGLWVSGNVSGLQIGNSQFLLNKKHGALIERGRDFIFHGCQFKANSITNPQQYFGLSIFDNVNFWTVANCQSGAIGEFASANVQRGGYRIGAGAPKGVFANNAAIGSMVVSWDIYSTLLNNTGNVTM